MNNDEIIIHNWDQLKAALEVGQELKSPLFLSSPPGAVGYAGINYFNNLIIHAHQDYPDVTFRFTLNCGDSAGWVLSSLRHGIKRVSFIGEKVMQEKLASIARQYNAELITSLPQDVLDLEGCDDANQACRDWLLRRSTHGANQQSNVVAHHS